MRGSLFLRVHVQLRIKDFLLCFFSQGRLDELVNEVEEKLKKLEAPPS